MANDNDNIDTKGASSVTDAPQGLLSQPPQVIVQMITPQAGEPTEGLSETRPGGFYKDADNSYKDANGQPVKGK